MQDNNNAKRKFDLLMQSLCGAEERDEALEQIKDTAFRILIENPGTEKPDWTRSLVEQCGELLIDAYGTDPHTIVASLDDLWESPYLDPRTGLEKSFSAWALVFATDESVQLYYDLT